MENKPYDYSFIRHGDDVAIKEILSMSKGEKSLLKVETGQLNVDKDRLNKYSEIVKENLGKEINNYNLETKIINNKLSLIINRIK